MKKISTLSVVCGALLLSGALCGNAYAQSITVLQNSATLADSFGTDSGPEALTVQYVVSYNTLNDEYTYTYMVQNPVGDVLLNNDGSPTSDPEIVDAFSVAFNTTIPGAYIPDTQEGGVNDQNNLTSGLFWSFAAVNPGGNSAILSFESYLPPTLGNANAQDANPPSPWSSNPDGQQVPVPNTVPEPAAATLFGLTALLLLPFRTSILNLIRNKTNASLPR